MPTYGYACGHCNHTFDAFQSITAKPLRKCPACGQTALKRLIGTGAGIIFKGSGFYCTDYRGDGYTEAAQTDTGNDAKDKSAEKKETKTESTAVSSSGKSESVSPAKKKSA